MGKHAAAASLSLFSNHLFSLLCPRLPGISPTFTISSTTKTCNNSNRHRQANKYFMERFVKAHNPRGSDKSFAKLHSQRMDDCLHGSAFYHSLPIVLLQWQFNTFMKKKTKRDKCTSGTSTASAIFATARGRSCVELNDSFCVNM